ncbi:MAG: hypothetical protein ACREFX_11830, partial [Opitutaceae bacterium]
LESFRGGINEGLSLAGFRNALGIATMSDNDGDGRPHIDICDRRKKGDEDGPGSSHPVLDLCHGSFHSGAERQKPRTTQLT